MGNIINYIEENLDTFEERNLNDVDSLIFSQLSYLFFDEIIPSLADGFKTIKIKELIKLEYFDEIFSDLRYVELNKQLLFNMAASPRFRDVEVMFYANEISYDEEKQFSAMTFLLSEKIAYVAFRGTDNTFLGWKEDFNMAFMTPVPSQEQARKYLNKVTSIISHKIYVGGHSKGGNLAVYSAMKSYEDVKDRIIAIFNHDGPGFIRSIVEGYEYNSICQKISKTVPVESVVGMVLESKEKYIVVKSNGFGILQHDPYSWEIGNVDFETSDDLSKAAKIQKNALSDWINALDEERKMDFVNTLFSVIDAMDSKLVIDFSSTWQSELLAIINATRNLDSESRKILFDTIRLLISKYFQSLSSNSFLTLNKKNIIRDIKSLNNK